MRRVTAFALFVVMVVTAIPAAAGPRATEVDELRTKETDVEVFMEARASARQIDRVRRVLRRSPGVRRLAFLDHDAAYDEFTRVFRDDPKLVESIRPDDLPTSFRVDTSSNAAADELARRARDLVGVGDAVTMYPWSVAKTIIAIADCRVRGDTSLEVFMDLGATPTELEATRQIVEEEPGLQVMRVMSPDDAYADLVEIYASRPAQVAGVRPEDLPMSIRARTDSWPSRELLDRLEALPGVESVGTNNGMCEDIFRLLAEGLTDEQVARRFIEQRWGGES